VRSLVLRRRGARAWYILVVAAAASVAAHAPKACVHVSTPSSVPASPSSATRVPATRAFACGLAAYVALALAGWFTGLAWLDVLAAFALVTLFLLPALRDRSTAAWLAWLAWLASGALFGLLAARGEGRFALDLMPALVNAILCSLFARTLRQGREPLIARFIGVIEGPDRLRMPGVAGYARVLTAAWMLLLGMQALALVLLAAVLPSGPLAAAGWIAPAHAAAWRWYLHLGSYLVVCAFLVLEYAWRRWQLRHVPHLPLPRFLARLARRWPSLLGSLASERVER
jgi:hypothetical protein